MSAGNPNPMEKSMVSVLVVANAGGGSPLPCGVFSPPPLALVSLPPVPGWPTFPHFSSPLSPTPYFLPSLRTAPPLLSPRFFVGGVASPRLPFPSTVWTLMPPLLMTSAQVFFIEVLVVRGWCEFFPRPPVLIVRGLLLVSITHLLLVFSFLLFFCMAFPSTIFHPSFSTRAVVVGVSGSMVSWTALLSGRGLVMSSVEVMARGHGGYLCMRVSSAS
jgi:hypothetical protein